MKMTEAIEMYNRSGRDVFTAEDIQAIHAAAAGSEFDMITLALNAGYMVGRQQAAGDLLKAGRNRNGMTLQEAAAAMDITPQALKEYEAGDRIPQEEVQQTIEALYPLLTELYK